MKRYIKRGIKTVFLTEIVLKNIGITEEDYKGGKWIEVSEAQAEFYEENPRASLSEILSMEMIPLPPMPEIPIDEQYKNLVISKIRERYSVDDELAIHRKRDVETNKFIEYDVFCEECKAEAKQELGLIWTEGER